MSEEITVWGCRGNENGRTIVYTIPRFKTTCLQPSFLRPRAPDLSPPPSDPGLQTSALLHQIQESRSQLFFLRPRDPGPDLLPQTQTSALLPQTQGSRFRPPPSDSGVQIQPSSLRLRCPVPALLYQTQGSRPQSSSLRSRSIGSTSPSSDLGIQA